MIDTNLYYPFFIILTQKTIENQLLLFVSNRRVLVVKIIRHLGLAHTAIKRKTMYQNVLAAYGWRFA